MNNYIRLNARKEYPFLSEICQNYQIIRDEINALVKDDADCKCFSPIPTEAKYQLNDPSLWKVLALELHKKDPISIAKEYNLGAYYPDEAIAYIESIRTRYLPKTISLLSPILSNKENGIINVFFSKHEPGTKLKLHINNDPYMYRAHIGLVIPKAEKEMLGFKVKDEIVQWREGECFTFAPTNPHTAWNLTDSYRIILIIDFFKTR